jgi:hypothetical protein
MADLQSEASGTQASDPSTTSGDGSSRFAHGFAQEGTNRHLDNPATTPAADPDLSRILDAWPTLPAHIRAAVLALVATAC